MGSRLPCSPALKKACLVSINFLAETLRETTDPVERRGIANLRLRITAARLKALPAPAAADRSSRIAACEPRRHPRDRCGQHE